MRVCILLVKLVVVGTNCSRRMRCRQLTDEPLETSFLSDEADANAILSRSSWKIVLPCELPHVRFVEVANGEHELCEVSIQSLQHMRDVLCVICAPVPLRESNFDPYVGCGYDRVSKSQRWRPIASPRSGL